MKRPNGLCLNLIPRSEASGDASFLVIWFGRSIESPYHPAKIRVFSTQLGHNLVQFDDGLLGPQPQVAVFG